MSAFHLFLHGPPGPGAPWEPMPAGCELVGEGLVHGTLYRADGVGTVLLLYGNARVPGHVWLCPADSLGHLDRQAGTAEGRRRRVASRVSLGKGNQEVPCWLYVAGPAVSRQLTPERRASVAG